MSRSSARSGEVSGPEGRSRFAIAFDTAQERDFAKLGGKSASLAALIAAAVPVPAGFALSTDAYDAMLDTADLRGAIARLLTDHDPDDVTGQKQISEQIRNAIRTRPLPAPVAEAVAANYRALCAGRDQDVPVAVRSSATAEDTRETSFAGLGDTYLWIVGENAVLECVKSCWASLFNPRALAYCANRALRQIDIKMAVAVQVMVDAEASGVAMTLDPSNGDRSKIVVEASWGLGEPIVSGEVTPDQFLLDKIMLAMIRTRLAVKTRELVADPTARRTVLREVSQEKQQQPCLTESQLRVIATFAKEIEQRFRAPQDIEWAIDRHCADHSGVMFLQSRPETVWSRKAPAPGKAYATGIEGIINTLLTPVVVKRQ